MLAYLLESFKRSVVVKVGLRGSCPRSSNDVNQNSERPFSIVSPIFCPLDHLSKGPTATICCGLMIQGISLSPRFS